MNSRLRIPGIFLAALAATWLLGGAGMTFAADEDFAALAARLQKSKPDFAQRHQKLLAERYDLADRPAASAAMSRGQPVQEKKDLVAFMRAL